jgi:uncharacterized RDD family membrane protein YckC
MPHADCRAVAETAVGSGAMEPAFPREATRVSGRRFVAHLADGVVFLLIFVVLLVPASIWSDLLLVIELVLIPTVGQVAYYVLTQRRSGRSPGKRLVGIRVVDADGRPPRTGALVKRTVPLLIEYLYVFAWASMMTSAYRQRLGDRWGKTYVVTD